MSQATTADADRRRKGLVLFFTSLFVGLLISGAAAATLVATSGPKDGSAVSNGPKTLIVPDKTLGYGS